MTSRQLFSRLFFIVSLAFAGPLRAQGTASVASIPRTSSIDAEALLAVMRLAAGVVPDDIDAIESRLQRVSGRGSAMRAITELGFGLRGSGPALRATSDDPTITLLVYQAARDTAGVRETIAALDVARARLALRNLPPPLTLAQAELAIGDSGAALIRLLAFEASWTTMEQQVSWGMVQNGWLLRRTWIQLRDLAHAMGRRADAERAYGHIEGATEARGADSSTGTFSLRAIPESGTGARFRYDAVLWMQPTALAMAAPARPLARLGFVTSERTAPTARGVVTTQTYDSIILDMSLLDALGAEGLTLRRQIQGAAGSMTATTDVDSLGHSTHRALHTDALLPEELRTLIERGVGFGPLSGAVALPAGAVSIGDSWRDTVALAIPGSAASVTLTATYRLARITTTGGRRLAFITIDAGTGTPRAQPDGGRVQATLTGELVRDLATGESLRLAASLRATVFAANGAATPVRVLLTAMKL